jgi:hypothetical protein
MSISIAEPRPLLAYGRPNQPHKAKVIIAVPAAIALEGPNSLECDVKIDTQSHRERQQGRHGYYVGQSLETLVVVAFCDNAVIRPWRDQQSDH